MKQDTRYKNNTKQTYNIALSHSHLSSVLRVQWHEKMKDKPDLNTNALWLLKGILDLHDLLAFFFRQTPSAAFGAENRAFVGRKMCVLIAAQIRFFARVQIPLVNFWAHYKIV